jgi:RHS repeat-associated protein
MATDRRFTGQREEAAIGLYDYKARYYDPVIGRFIQADTIVPEPGNPQFLNRFSYAANSPLSFIDPNGHQIRPPNSCGTLCWTGTTGPYNRSGPTIQVSSSDLQALTVGTAKSASDSFIAAPSKIIPSERGAIVRYNTDVHVTPKLTLVGAKGPIEGHVTYVLQDGAVTKNTEAHVAGSVPFPVPVSPVSVGGDWQIGGQVVPEIAFGLNVVGQVEAGAFWSGNELGIEGKWQGSGAEGSIVVMEAGDHFIVTDGAKYNRLGAEQLAVRYLHREDAEYLGIYYYADYTTALQAMLGFDLLHRSQTDFPPSWVATGEK